MAENITFGGLVLHSPEVDIELSFCLFKASYTVWNIAHSARMDDASNLDSTSRPIPTYYPLETYTCRAIWNSQKFKLPGFEEKWFHLSKENLSLDGRLLQTGETKTFRFNEKFLKGGKNVGYQFATGIPWKNPAGQKIHGGVVIDGEVTVGKLLANFDKSSTPWSLLFKDPTGKQVACSFPGSYFEFDSVTYLPQFFNQCEMKSIYMFDNSKKGQ